MICKFKLVLPNFILFCIICSNNLYKKFHYIIFNKFIFLLHLCFLSFASFPPLTYKINELYRFKRCTVIVSFSITKLIQLLILLLRVKCRSKLQNYFNLHLWSEIKGLYSLYDLSLKNNLTINIKPV